MSPGWAGGTARTKKKPARILPREFFAPVFSLPKPPEELSRSSSPCGAATVVQNTGAPISELRAGAAFSRCAERRCFTIRNVGKAITSEILLQRYVPPSCMAGHGLGKCYARLQARRVAEQNWLCWYILPLLFRAAKARRTGGLKHPNNSRRCFPSDLCMPAEILLAITGRFRGPRKSVGFDPPSVIDTGPAGRSAWIWSLFAVCSSFLWAWHVFCCSLSVSQSWWTRQSAWCWVPR